MSANTEMATELVQGALAGGASTWLMGRTTEYLYEHEDAAARSREEAARGGQTAYARAAQKGMGLLGVHLTPEEASRAGVVIHWGLGMAAGGVYAMLRRRAPRIAAGWGLAYGAAFFLLMDEGANVALGLTPGPRAFPWQSHARGLAGHLVFGVSAEIGLRALEALDALRS